jgi:hypothetical protein
MPSWLRAGIVGAAVLIVLDLLGLIPCVGLITCILGLFAYPAIGALAAYWLPPVRDAGQGAGQGALAALVAALASGLVNTILFLIQASAMGSAQILSQVPAETLRQLEEAGIDPSFLDTFAGPVGALIGGGTCCAGGLIVGAVLGAIGGALFAALRPGSPHADS